MKSRYKRVVPRVALLALLGASAQAIAATFGIASMNITAGTFDLDGPGGVPGSSYGVIGPNTNLVGGYIGNGGSGLAANFADADSIVSTQFSGFPINAYTAASNLGDDNTAAGTLPGGPVPTGVLDTVAGTITLDLSSWFLNWNDNDIAAGTGKNDGVTSAFATGTWDPLTGAYQLSWQSLNAGPKSSLVLVFTLAGVATPVPEPAAYWLFTAGLIGVAGGVGRRRKSETKRS